MKNKESKVIPFTSYQKFAVFILANTQFTVILDFMVMSPLGDILMKSMQLKPSHFGVIESISMAIVTDLFSMQQRGRVMSTI
ncbi:hypothetical protein ABS764_14680 [Flavobacterium sp. ST-87]|uniref:MFS transporter n=1 Tax=Flavobacterium plantiphilum TaxID=3163297 RepID=A0ABW8XYD5_9FLAO